MRPHSMTGRDGRDRPLPDSEALRVALDVRREWLGHALSTEPADRDTAEASISELYSSLGQAPPRFVWVDSPGAAVEPHSPVPASPAHPTAGSIFHRARDWPLHNRIAGLEQDLRGELDERIRGRSHSTSPLRGASPRSTTHVIDPHTALGRGTELRRIMEVAVGDALRRSVVDAVRAPLVDRFAVAACERPHGLTFFGQHDAHHIGRYDAWLRTGLISVGPAALRRFRVWADIARSCGWWWPGAAVCVLAERPVALRTEALPFDPHEGVRLHADHGPAVAYPDGWGVYAVHGTPVPEWVVTDPTPERIAAEPNVEVRRTAIERIGWDAYIEGSGFGFVATAPDPANEGAQLRLYDRPAEGWSAPRRLLTAVNGSVERDGTRRRYGLDVPADFDDPVAAAAWTYGLTGDVYARLARRT